MTTLVTLILNVECLEYHDLGYFGFYADDLSSIGLNSIDITSIDDNTINTIGSSAIISEGNQGIRIQSSSLLKNDNKLLENNNDDGISLEYTCGTSTCKIQLDINSIRNRPSVNVAASFGINVKWFDEEGNELSTDNPVYEANQG